MREDTTEANDRTHRRGPDCGAAGAEAPDNDRVEPEAPSADLLALACAQPELVPPSAAQSDNTHTNNYNY